MNPLRTIERTAVEGSLKLARMPVDTAIRFLPGNGEGPAGRARLAVDHADASVRMALGALLRDTEISQDAVRRATAVDERRRAAELRARAERAGDQADERLDRRSAQAERERKQAAQRAQARRRTAEQKREERVEQAEKAENARRRASRNASQQAEEAVAKREPRVKLQALEEKDAALAVKERALTAADEANRLGDAAARAKAERKNEV